MFLNVARAYAFLFFLSFIHCSPLVTSDHESPRVSLQARGIPLPCDVKTELEELMAQTTHMIPDRPVDVFDPRDAFAEPLGLSKDYIAQIPDFKHGILIIVSTGEFDWFGFNKTDEKEAVDNLLTGTLWPSISRRSLRDDLKERDSEPDDSEEKTQSLKESLKRYEPDYDYLQNASVLIVGAGTTSGRLNEIEDQVRQVIHPLNDEAQISSRTVLLRLVDNTEFDGTDIALRLSTLPKSQSLRRIEIYLGVYRRGERPYMQQDLIMTGEWGKSVEFSLEKAQWEL